MSLSRKTGLVISLTLIGLIAILSVLTRLILLDSFSRLETTDTQQHIARASAALADDLDQLNGAVGDWAPWDDTYAFMLDGNPAYISANLADSTFVTLRLNVMLFVNTSGQIIFGQGFQAQQQQPLPNALSASLLAHSELLHSTDVDGHTVGLVRVPHGILLVASHPILTNEHTGPSRGTLIFGRWLDANEINRLATITHTSIAAWPSDDPALPPDFQAARIGLSDQSASLVRAQDDQQVAGYTLLNDIDGQPALLWRVSVPRLIYAQGQNTLAYFVVSLLVVGVVFSTLIPLLLERLVLARLRALNGSVSSIQHSGNLADRVPATGRDELANLGQSINGMLDALHHSAETLRASEQRYRLLFENMQTGFAYCQMVYDAQGDPADFIYLDVNAAFEHLTGLKHVIGRTVTEIIPGIKESTPQLLEVYGRVAQTGAPEKLELDFTPLAMWLSISVYSTAPGYFAVVFDNITKRKQAEAAEHEQRRLAEALRDTAAALSSTLNFDEVLDRILISMERVIAYDAAGILLLNDDRTIAYPVRYLSHQTTHQLADAPQLLLTIAAARNLREMLETGQPVIVADIETDPDWVKSPLAVCTGSSLGLPICVQGKTIGFLTIDKAHIGGFTSTDADRLKAFADQVAVAIENARLFTQIQQHAAELEQRVAERTRDLTNSNQQLAAANDRLSELDRLKSKFVSDVSHELRTPVTSLGLYLDLMNCGKPEKRDHYLLQATTQVARLRGLIEEILDLSRLDRQQQALNLERLDLNQVVAQIVNEQRPLAEEAGLTLALCPATEVLLVQGDHGQVLRAIRNLVANAIKYTPTGSVQITTLSGGARVGVQVCDTGMGIAPNDLPHVFDRFYRGQQVAQSSIPGTGLGLAIVKEIAEAHVGTVEVESMPGQGSTFWLWLPCIIN